MAAVNPDSDQDKRKQAKKPNPKDGSRNHEKGSGNKKKARRGA
jgi:hypothetical protein